jgi:hypothetical protein
MLLREWWAHTQLGLIEAQMGPPRPIIAVLVEIQMPQGIPLVVLTVEYFSVLITKSLHTK